MAPSHHAHGFGAWCCRLSCHLPPGTNCRSCRGRGATVVLSTPLLGRGGMVPRTSRGPLPCWRNAGSSRSFDREQDHVIAGASRHELETPKPNHRGVRNRRGESGHLERNGKSVKKHAGPLPGTPTVIVFALGGHTQLVNLYACSLFQMVMQKDTKIYPGSGKRRPYVQRGWESLYYSAPKCLYRGEYKRGME